MNNQIELNRNNKNIMHKKYDTSAIKFQYFIYNIIYNNCIIIII